MINERLSEFAFGLICHPRIAELRKIDVAELELPADPFDFVISPVGAQVDQKSRDACEISLVVHVQLINVL